MEEYKDILLELATISFNEQKRYLASMSEDARTAKGKVDHWSPKDVLAHVAHWDSMMAADLADPENRSPAQEVEDFNRTNARIWEQYAKSPWDEIEALVDKAHGDMVTHLLKLSEEEITDSERYEWLSGRPIWRAVTSTNFFHALAHLAVLYADQGELEHGNQIQEQAAEHQLRLSDSDEWRGTVAYNLGCHYAVTGQKEEALKNIGKGLVLYPVLSKWAPDDPDLASLHSDSTFLAMIEEE
ncbi:MAG TPA: ClbS/DfsB family four-helix bundle protein [candidate division Zixibacteria bacterium]|nr:ClbS/DfsB family four-helix bundle protein [candidate division Zixibacteria bacterium]